MDVQDFLPVYVDGATDPDAPGRLTVHTDMDGASGATRTVGTVQEDLYAALAGDQEDQEPTDGHEGPPSCHGCGTPLVERPGQSLSPPGRWYVHPPTVDAPHAPTTGIGHTLTAFHPDHPDH